jgi:hypothetical protein
VLTRINVVVTYQVDGKEIAILTILRGERER